MQPTDLVLPWRAIGIQQRREGQPNEDRSCGINKNKYREHVAEMTRDYILDRQIRVVSR